MPRTLARRRHPLTVIERQLDVLEHAAGVPPFAQKLAEAGLHPLTRRPLRIMQINVGKMCNQTCRHCHVDAGPDRTEIMTRETMELCLAALEKTRIEIVDITGGAPEMNPHFCWLVEQVRARGRHVIDRCNLTILTVPAYGHMVDFLARHRVEIIASLPYYTGRQTDAQRGEGVFDRSIRALRMLNEAGYGQPDSGLVLNLVYNPVGAFLPGRQQALEADFKRELKRRYGVVFNQLFTITNVPIHRYLEYLLESGNYEGYMQRLVRAFNPAAAAGVMCRETLSVGWDGRLYDCDFNQQIDWRLERPLPQHIRDFDPAAFENAPIRVGQHCYACTAGCGSSCGGAIIEDPA